jgi:PIN domain nuclease of toxin-antitoxin system
LSPRILLDTHIVLRWLGDPARLSREQTRMLAEAVRHRETVAISAITLLEVAILPREGPRRVRFNLDELLGQIESSPVFCILPFTVEIAKEVSILGILKDPVDRVIVATARVHGLRLLTSDQRIISSNVVSTVD